MKDRPRTAGVEHGTCLIEDLRGLRLSNLPIPFGTGLWTMRGITTSGRFLGRWHHSKNAASIG
jgi:hypothetical protein